MQPAIPPIPFCEIPWFATQEQTQLMLHIHTATDLSSLPSLATSRACPSHPCAATGKKKGRKAAGGGGVLGKLGLKKGREEGAEEEPPGAGTAGSPRYIQVRL